jgi:hypothetical protein
VISRISVSLIMCTGGAWPQLVVVLFRRRGGALMRHALAPKTCKLASLLGWTTPQLSHQNKEGRVRVRKR